MLAFFPVDFGGWPVRDRDRSGVRERLQSAAAGVGVRRRKTAIDPAVPLPATDDSSILYIYMGK